MILALADMLPAARCACAIERSACHQNRGAESGPLSFSPVIEMYIAPQ